MGPKSPRSPQKMGFMPLSNAPTNPDAEIPLSTIRSNGSGARKANQGVFQSVEMDSTEGEKTGFAGRRRLVKDLSRSETAGSDEFSLNAMGRIYNKIIGFSPITRYLVYVVPVSFLLAVPLIILPITGDKDRVKLGTGLGSDGVTTVPGPSLFMLFVWIEISWLSLWVGKSVAELLPPVFMFFCGVISSGTRKYATVLRALAIPLSLFFWGLTSWLTFKFFFQNDTVDWVNTLKRILLSLYLSSAVLLGEKFIVQLISISYHQRSFANRIKDSKREVFLLGLLYDASRTLFPMYCPEFTEEDYIINDSIEMKLGGKRGHRRHGSVTPMRLIGDVGRIGDKITSVFGNIASEITGKTVFNPNSAHSIVVEALEKMRSSEAMARRIWMSFVVEGKDTLSVDDIIEVLGPAHREEAEEAFALIDADQNGDISLDEMVRKIVEIGKERKALANSMKDISEALAVFDKVLLTVVGVICVIIFLAVFQSTFIATLTTAGTTLLSLSFVFAVTTQEFLGSCIFLFVKHPYDVGDRVDITGGEKQQLVVDKISLLYTVFTRIDKMQVVQVPNIVLNNLWIENVTRSKAMKEVVEINVSYDTTFEDIELLRLEMEKFVRAPENARDFQPDLAIGIGGVGDLDKLNLKVVIKHKSNWHNDGVRATRRSKFICALALALKRVPILAPGGGGEPLGGHSNPTYSVAVTDEFAASQREQADKAKQAGRLANQPPSRQGSRGSSKAAEMRAVQEINTHDPLSEAMDDWAYEETLSGREASTERPRAGTNASSRLPMNKGESQRGRRKAGDVLPPMPLAENVPGVQVTRAVSNSTRAASFDVERQMGMQGPTPAQYAGAAYAAQQQAGNDGYAAWSSQQTMYAADPATGLQPHPLQSAPSATSNPTGARARGASVSRTQAQHQADRGPNAAGSSSQQY